MVKARDGTSCKYSSYRGVCVDGKCEVSPASSLLCPFFPLLRVACRVCLKLVKSNTFAVAGLIIREEYKYEDS